MEQTTQDGAARTQRETLPVVVEPPAEPGSGGRDRLAFLREKSDPRFDVYRSLYAKYEPPPYPSLTDEELGIVRQWYEDILGMGLRGETGPALVGIMQSFIAVSGLSRVVQLGHWAGYSTLMLGFELRRMGLKRALFTADINPRVTEITRRWVQRADLGPTVHVHCNDSASPDTAKAAREYLGGRPEVVLIDSSHQYEHTIAELDQWYEELQPGGLLFMHDVSDFAAQFDSTRGGGVRRALQEWISDKSIECLRLNHLMPELNSRLGYIDACGLAIMQKPYREQDDKLREFAAKCVALREIWAQHDQPPWSRLTGTLDAMLIGIRAAPATDPHDFGIRFECGQRVRMSLAFNASTSLDSLRLTLSVPGPNGPLAERTVTEPLRLAKGMNAVELEFNWPTLPPGRRPISVDLRRIPTEGGGNESVCHVDRGVLMHTTPQDSATETRPGAATDSAVQLIAVEDISDSQR